MLFDANRLLRLIDIQCARINDVTGVIMLCRGHKVSLYTLNGDMILEQNVCVEDDDTIISCAFYEGSGNEYLERDLIFTGHKRGVVNVSFQQPFGDFRRICSSPCRYGKNRYGTTCLSWSMLSACITSTRQVST